jgi:hypothetical protein
MSEKPEALRLADDLTTKADAMKSLMEAAQILRIQHARNMDLLDDNERLTADNERLTADNERLREALDKSLTDEQIRQIAASIDRSMPLKSAKILFARRIEAALRREDV